MSQSTKLVVVAFFFVAYVFFCPSVGPAHGLYVCPREQKGVGGNIRSFTRGVFGELMPFVGNDIKLGYYPKLPRPLIQSWCTVAARLFGQSSWYE